MTVVDEIVVRRLERVDYLPTLDAMRRFTRSRDGATADELWLLGFLGGPRLDQALANVLLLAGLDAPAVVLDERNEARVVRPSLSGAPRGLETIGRGALSGS